MKKKETLLFLTGHLSFKPLNAMLTTMKMKKKWELRNIGVQVASLMTNKIIIRRLTDIDHVSQMILPGRMQGDMDDLRRHFGIDVVRGPDDWRDIPEFLGQTKSPPDLTHYDCRIFAEITDAPLLDDGAFYRQAVRLQKEGADVIDVGCLPDVSFAKLEERICKLCAQGITVSIDSADYDELKRGVRAGASYILSLDEDSLPQAHKDGIIPQAIPVLIPTKNQESIHRAIDWCKARKIDFLADPILDPLHHGLMSSLERYHQLRKTYPSIKLFMGVGNVTELHDVDSAGTVSLLMGLASELEVHGVLMVAVSPHCVRAIKESDRARRIHFYAKQHSIAPNGIDDSLIALHDRKPAWFKAQEIKEMAQDVRDPNYRIMLSTQGIHVFNNRDYVVARTAHEIFAQLSLKDDLSHAYYLGMELMKAETAWRLGKKYDQDRPLHWGIAARDIDEHE